MNFDELISVGKLAFGYELPKAAQSDLIDKIGAKPVFEIYKDVNIDLFSALSICKLWDGHAINDRTLFYEVERLFEDGYDLYEQVRKLCSFVEKNGTNFNYYSEFSELSDIIINYETILEMASKYGHDSFPLGTVRHYLQGDGYDETDYFDVQFTDSFYCIGATPERTFKRNINVARDVLIRKFCAIIIDIFLDMLMVDKEQSVLFLDSLNFKLLEDIDGLTKHYVKLLLCAQNNAKGTIKFSSSEITQKIQGVSVTTLVAWRKALEEYEKLPGRRHNDALPKRMDVYLSKLEGKSSKNIQDKYPEENLARLIATAQQNDIARLMSIYPSLPPLPEISAAVKKKKL